MAAKEAATIQKIRFPELYHSFVLVAAGNKANLFNIQDGKIVKSFVDSQDIVTACAIRPDSISPK